MGCTSSTGIPEKDAAVEFSAAFQPGSRPQSIDRTPSDSNIRSSRQQSLDRRQASMDNSSGSDKMRRASSEDFQKNIPKRKVGFLMKQGHQVKNWKRRFFVLFQGKLTYFVDRSKKEKDAGVDEKGKLLLHDYVIIKGFTGKKNLSILLSHKSSPEKDYLIEASSPEERAEWDSALMIHIKFACYLLAQKEKGYEAFATIH